MKKKERARKPLRKAEVNRIYHGGRVESIRKIVRDALLAEIVEVAESLNVYDVSSAYPQVRRADLE